MIDFTTKLIKSKFLTVSKSSKPKITKEHIQHGTVKYHKESKTFVIEVVIKDITVLLECVWSLDSIHAGYLYSSEKNDYHELWTRIKWPELTKDLNRLKMILVMWSVLKPGLKVDYVICGEQARIIQVYDKS